MTNEPQFTNQSQEHSDADLDDIHGDIHDPAFAGRDVHQTTVKGNVETEGGDYVGRDKITQGDEVSGDKITGDIVHGDQVINNWNVHVHSPTERMLRGSGRCDFYQHIALPPNYVLRADLLADMRATLLAKDNGDALAYTSFIRMNALHGMGGIGKSVIARALCDDPAVQTAFPDGILWATLGKKPDLTTHLREWVVEGLGGVISENVTTVNSLKNRLAQLLEYRSCLLIVDDVWRVGDAEVFQVGGSNCRILITTRDAVIAEELNATIRHIPAMTQREALSLLKEWGGQKLQNAELEPLVHIVERLGRLPLAIKLAGGQLRRQPPDHWLSNFDARKLKSRRIEDVHDSLEATFALSLDDLNDSDRELYTSLAIFKVDEATSAVAIAKLWEALDRLDNDGIVELLHDLSARALLQLNLGQSTSKVDGIKLYSDMTVTLHDLLRDFISAKLGEVGRLRAHQALLNAYRQTCSDESWASASDDGYLYDHLAYHLNYLATNEDKVAYEELKALFDNQDWLRVRVAATDYQYDGYISDLMLAWEHTNSLAYNQLNDDQLPSAFADCLRFALIRTSINSLAANFEAKLSAQAIDTGLLLPQHALSIAKKIPRTEKRSKFIAKILETDRFQEQSKQKFGRSIGEYWLKAAMDIDSEEHRARVLAALPRYLDKEQLQKVRDEVLNMESEEHRARVLTALAPYLEGKNRQNILCKALIEIQSIENEWVRAKYIESLAPILKEKLLQRGLDIALNVALERPRAKALAALAPHLERGDRQAALQNSLDAIRRIKNEGTQAIYIELLAPLLKEELLQRGLAVANRISSDVDRTKALAALVPYLNDEDRQDILKKGLNAIQLTKSDWARAKYIESLAPLLKEDLLDYAISIKIDRHQADALKALIPYLSDEQRQKVFKTAKTIESPVARSIVMEKLVPHFNEEARHHALHEAETSAFKIQNNPAVKAKVLVDLAYYQDNENKYRAYQEILGPDIQGERFQSTALCMLASKLSGEVQQRALRTGLDAALAISNKKTRKNAICELAPQLSEEDKDHALQEAPEAAKTIKGEHYQTDIQDVPAPHLNGHLMQNALRAALAIADEEARVNAICELAPYLDERDKEYVLEEALEAMQVIISEHSRAEALAALAPYLNGRLLQKALKTAQVIKSAWCKMKALDSFIPLSTNCDIPLKQIQQNFLDTLYHLQNRKRDDILHFLCVSSSLFSTSVLPIEVRKDITENIIEICKEWEWL